MAKLLVSLGAVLFFGLGAASAERDVRQEPLNLPEPSAEQTYAGYAAEEDAVANTTKGSPPPVRIGQMSDEEKERRRQECDTVNDACYDWCNRSKGGTRCKTECDKKYEQCLKKIPSNPVTPPDY